MKAIILAIGQGTKMKISEMVGQRLILPGIMRKPWSGGKMGVLWESSNYEIWLKLKEKVW